MEPVRCVARSRTSPASFSRASARSRSRSARPSSSSSGSRKSPSTLWRKPGSSRSRPRAYLKAGPAAHGPRCVAVGQIEQELRHAHRGQLRRRDPRAPVPRIPPGDVLIRPQAAEPIPHPHRRRPGRVTRPRHPRSQLRDPGPQAGTDRHHALLTISRDTHFPARPASCVTVVSQIPRFPAESSLGVS